MLVGLQVEVGAVLVPGHEALVAGLLQPAGDVIDEQVGPREVLDGVRLVWKIRWLTALQAIAVIHVLLAVAPWMVLVPVLAQRELGGVGTYGILLGAFAAAALAVVLVVSCGILLDSSLRAPIRVQRLADAGVVVQHRDGRIEAGCGSRWSAQLDLGDGLCAGFEGETAGLLVERNEIRDRSGRLGRPGDGTAPRCRAQGVDAGAASDRRPARGGGVERPAGSPRPKARAGSRCRPTSRGGSTGYRAPGGGTRWARASPGHTRDACA